MGRLAAVLLGAGLLLGTSCAARAAVIDINFGPILTSNPVQVDITSGLDIITGSTTFVPLFQVAADGTVFENTNLEQTTFTQSFPDIGGGIAFGAPFNTSLNVDPATGTTLGLTVEGTSAWFDSNGGNDLANGDTFTIPAGGGVPPGESYSVGFTNTADSNGSLAFGANVASLPEPSMVLLLGGLLGVVALKKFYL